MRREEPQPSHETRYVERPDVSVIIVSWNVREFLRRCIESIISTRGNIILEIIVIDNASGDESCEMVRSEFDEVILIASESNLGFGPANNVGITHARGRYVFFLNPDTIVQKGALRTLVEFLDREPECDMVGPRVMNPDGSIQRACARTLPTVTLELFEALYLHRLPVIGLPLHDRLVSPYDLSGSQEVEAISGAAMFVRKDAIQQLGGFDESFLHTAEDVDLCLRLRRRAGRIHFLPDAEVVHFAGQSSAVASVRTGAMAFVSMREFFRRSQGRLHGFLYQLIAQLIRMPMLILVGMGKAFITKDFAGLQTRIRLARAIWTSRIED